MTLTTLTVPFRLFARLYNGPAYAQNRYDEKLSTAYSSFNK